MIQSGWVGRQNGCTLITRGLYLQNWNTDLPIFSVFFLRYSVFFGIWNIDFGIGIGILKYLGIRYRLPTQDYNNVDWTFVDRIVAETPSSLDQNSRLKRTTDV